MPGLTLALGDVSNFERVLNTLVGEMRGGLLPNMGDASNPAFNSVDAPLWLFATVQEYCLTTGDYARAWSLWGKALRDVYRRFSTGSGLPFGIRVHDNGLLWAGEPGFALTWMDAVVGGVGVTPRIGYAVEINALWYNALRFMVEIGRKVGSSRYTRECEALADRVAESFARVFTLPDLGYLSDYVDEEGQHRAVRPNQIFAVSLPYSPVPEETQAAVVSTVERELYTPLGLRSLSPKNPAYHGRYEGSQPQRDSAYHQGTIWPWLLDAYTVAFARVRGQSAARGVCTEICETMERELHHAGLGSISEVYDGDPPHRPGGTIAQAWSVAAVVRIYQRLQQWERE